MTPLSPPVAVTGPVVQTRPQLDALLQNIVRLRHERDDFHRAQENEIAAVRQRYRAPLAELDHYLALETSWAEAWARENPGAFVSVGPVRSVSCGKVTLGFRADPPRLERASRRWTWSRIATTLAALPWGPRYLRVPPPEVDREALIADLAALSPVDLRNAGLIIEAGEHFFIRPHETAETSADQPSWQEAA
jgi:phage host-nuclease inhibitor protein Gam